MLEPSPENNLALEAAESEPEALGEAAGSEKDFFCPDELEPYERRYTRDLIGLGRPLTLGGL